MKVGDEVRVTTAHSMVNAGQTGVIKFLREISATIELKSGYLKYVLLENIEPVDLKAQLAEAERISAHRLELLNEHKKECVAQQDRINELKGELEILNCLKRELQVLKNENRGLRTSYANLFYNLLGTSYELNQLKEALKKLVDN